MSKINLKSAYAKEIFDQFEGVGESYSMEKQRTAMIRNFRILEDGTLEKRNGWEEWLSIDENIRGVWQGSLNGEDHCFVVAQEHIFRVKDGETEYLQDIHMSEDPTVTFLPFAGHLYLLDGKCLRMWRPEVNCFTEAEGYAPLLGVGWHPRTMGKTHEAINLFCNHARVQYTNTSGESVFHLPLLASSIDFVRVDGLPCYDYVLNNPANEVTVSTIGASVEIAFSFYSSNLHKNHLHRTTLAFSDFFGKREKLLLAGADMGQILYSASECTEAMLAASSSIYPDSDPLYFTDDGVLIVGDSKHPVTSLVRNRDRVLAFSAHGMHSIELSSSDDSVFAYTITHSIGCVSKGVNVNANGDPVICNENGIFTISAPPGDPDNFVAKKISGLIPELEDQVFAPNAILCLDTAHNEIWFRNRMAKDSVVWAYNPSQQKWYCFDGIQATLFCTINGRPGFVCGGKIRLFGEALCTDDGIPFEAILQTPYLSFGEPETMKRSLRFSLKANLGGNMIQILLESENRARSFSLSAPVRSAPTLFDRRAALGRFHFLRVTISDPEPARSKIHRFALYANL